MPAADLAVRARNRRIQTELYGAPLGDRVRRVMAMFGITQSKLAEVLGISPAMLSQLNSAKRARLGNLSAMARLETLDRRVEAATKQGPMAVEALLQEVAQSRPQWLTSGAMALREAASPAQLTAAADVLSAEFPSIALVLRDATTEGRAP